MNYDIDILELDNRIQNNVNISERQNKFLNSTLGKVINTGIDIVLKAVLPDFIENQIIEVKDVLMSNGLKDGVKEIVNQGIQLGKSASGIFTGEFENITQIENVVKKGGILDSTSKILDAALKFVESKNLLDKSTVRLIKQGKNSIISAVSNKIEESLTEQIKNIEKLENYCNKWKDSYNLKDIKGMEKAYKNLENYKEKVMPLKNIINQAEKIENIHTYIMNNGKTFEISDIEKELLNKLS